MTHEKQEKHELDAKLTGLKAFLKSETYTNLSVAEQRLLYRQAKAMQAYSTVLGERIAAAGV